ncbi:DUF6671 family protein [Aquibium oceanicum]|uniref:DUF6671 domain-containing protein n=1 Tax=Aquibium oceanicum TaxID=1670800 RepID=A0A1L3SXK7_9HYPH|nr:DUF6671 family protein [Aquibium oceanicum]APH74163.1 hypothetical protein BSQ44_24400 [Aquibium oceanicum]
MGRPLSVYDGGQAALATMHGKEQAFSAILHDILGLSVLVPEMIDTDALGTFTGEVPRKGTMLETVMAKARLGMTAMKLPRGLASEGAYGPHPQLPFVPGGIELVVLVDDVAGIIVHEHLVVDAPVFAHRSVAAISELEDFLTNNYFPSHALIVRPNLPDRVPGIIFKGIGSYCALDEAIAVCAKSSKDGKALVASDMRAHFNPTRMAAIQKAVRRLAVRLLTLCPDCDNPGFGLVDIETGLPCEECGGPSTLPLWEVYGCVKCKHVSRRRASDRASRASAAHCLFCNP